MNETSIGANLTAHQLPPTTVVNIRSTRQFDVYIGRGGPWGNPFRIGPDGTREQVVAEYDRWIESRPDLLARLGELRGRRLGCFCAPARCHGDVLARRADAL
jgi:hypothetical protein